MDLHGPVGLFSVTSRNGHQLKLRVALRVNPAVRGWHIDFLLKFLHQHGFGEG